MYFSFDNEFLLLDWLNVRNKKGMPAFKNTCNIGYKTNSLIFNVDFTNNNFSNTTRFHFYSFEFKDDVIVEKLSLIGMDLHFENKYEEKEKETFLHEIFPFFDVGYWEHLSSFKTDEELQSFLYELLLREDSLMLRKVLSEAILVSRGNDSIFLKTEKNGFFYIQNHQESADFAKDITQKIKRNRLKTIFTQ